MEQRQYQNRSGQMIRDNKILIAQIKESLSRDFLDMMRANPEGKFSFFIRKGKVSISNVEKKLKLAAEISLESSAKGLSRPAIKTLFDMLEDRLMNESYIDYGEINIAYKAAIDGTYTDGELTIKQAMYFDR